MFSSPSMILAFVLATAVPLLLVFFVLATRDTYQTISTPMMVVCLLWGGIGAFGLAYLIQNNLLYRTLNLDYLLTLHSLFPVDVYG